jgi:hypothetical protein
MTERDRLIGALRFGPMAQFMRGWTDWQRDAVVDAVADDLLRVGWALTPENVEPSYCRDAFTCGGCAPESADVHTRGEGAS